MIRMLLEGMLTDLGHTVAAEAGSIEEALSLAKEAEFDVALLDVNLNGQPITPVVEVLIARGVPFVFASGYGQRGVPEAYRDRVRRCRSRSRSKRWRKPLEAALAEGRRLNALRKKLRRAASWSARR